MSRFFFILTCARVTLGVSIVVTGVALVWSAASMV
jgi:hypothetical protein